MARLAQAWSARPARERWLLASLLFFFLPLALVYLVALPLIEQRDAARAAQDDERALYLWVQARDAEWQAGLKRSRTAPAVAPGIAAEPAGIAEVEAALDRAGLSPTVRTLENARDRQISLRLEDAPLSGVASFLEELGPVLGYRMARLRIAARPSPGLIAVDLDLEP
jgi:type II secretory pathway component PulM